MRGRQPNEPGEGSGTSEEQLDLTTPSARHSNLQWLLQRKSKSKAKQRQEALMHGHNLMVENGALVIVSSEYEHERHKRWMLEWFFVFPWLVVRPEKVEAEGNVQRYALGCSACMEHFEEHKPVGKTRDSLCNFDFVFVSLPLARGTQTAGCHRRACGM